MENDDEVSKMQEQFNAQRAKMKELYLHKEKECTQMKQKLHLMRKELDEAASQLVVTEYNRQKDLEDQKQEIQTLQTLLQETCEEATVANNEISMLKAENERGLKELRDLKELMVQQESNKSLESILGLKTLARNVKKITGTNSNSQENLEESKKATTTSKYAQEDADTLRSLVVPLEDEIQQLKEKLRSAYDEIEEIKGSDTKSKSALVGLLNEAQKESPEVEVACNLCKDYQVQLATAQETIEGEKAKVAKVEKIMDRLKEDLLKESALRLDLEKTWQEKREEHKDEVQKLCDEVNKSEMKMQTLQGEFGKFKEDVGRELLRLTEERDDVNEQLDVLQRDNDYLCGRYLEHSNELKAQDINLPQNIDELHELVLRLSENLILAKVGQEFSETKTISFRDEANLLRDQLTGKEKEREFLEQKLSQRIHSLEDKLKQQHHIHLKLLGDKEEMQKVDGENKKEISDLRMQNIELSESVERLEKTNIELRSKAHMMQQELATSEAVQKDFVKLSQSLQMQLEKIRSADTQVRWQDEDDCHICPTCKQGFTVTRRKLNCRHCGSIFCETCCSRVVKSSSGKQVRVCDLCHTLLEQNSAPFFSQNTPNSP